MCLCLCFHCGKKKLRGGLKILITRGVTASDWNAIFYLQSFQAFQMRLSLSWHCGPLSCTVVADVFEDLLHVVSVHPVWNLLQSIVIPFCICTLSCVFSSPLIVAKTHARWIEDFHHSWGHRLRLECHFLFPKV